MIFVNNYGLKVDFTALITEYNLPMDPSSYWVIQHWTALPKPHVGHYDLRSFAYLSCIGGELVYRSYPHSVLSAPYPLLMRPIQCTTPFAGKVPTAGNYFPNSIIVDNQDFTYLLVPYEPAI